MKEYLTLNCSSCSNWQIVNFVGHPSGVDPISAATTIIRDKSIFTSLPSLSNFAPPCVWNIASSIWPRGCYNQFIVSIYVVSIWCQNCVNSSCEMIPNIRQSQPWLCGGFAMVIHDMACCACDLLLLAGAWPVLAACMARGRFENGWAQCTRVRLWQVRGGNVNHLITLITVVISGPK